MTGEERIERKREGKGLEMEKKSKERKKKKGERKGKEEKGKEGRQGGERGLLVFRAGTAYTKLFGFRVGAPQCA